MDAQDHVWIIHRAGSLEPGEVHATTNPPTARVLRARAAGARVRSGRQPDRALGRPGRRATTGRTSNHGITVDYKGNVWIGGNGRGAGSRGAALVADATKARMAGAGGAFHDSMVLKFTQDGKFLMQIGKPAPSKGSNDVENLRLPAKMFVDPEDQRTVRRRRLRQPARDRVRRRHRQVQAPLGRLRPQARRHRPRRRTIRTRRPRSSSAIRCTAPSSRTTVCSTSATASTTASRCSRPTARS